MRSISLLAVTLGGLCACDGGDADTTVGLPDEDTSYQFDTAPTFFPSDTGNPADLDQTPEHTVTMRQWGQWNMAPIDAATYTSLTGELLVQEYIDGELPTPADDTDTPAEDRVELDCDLVYSVEGLPSETNCTGCDFTFEVTYYLLSGDPEQCNDPDLPQHEEVWRMGFHPGDDRVMVDYGGLDLWIPWFVALKIGDVVTLEWQATMGTLVEDEDED